MRDNGVHRRDRNRRVGQSQTNGRANLLGDFRLDELGRVVLEDHHLAIRRVWSPDVIRSGTASLHGVINKRTLSFWRVVHLEERLQTSITVSADQLREGLPHFV